MQEQRVGVEVAKLLKQLEYDKVTDYCYAYNQVYDGRVIDFDTECELEAEGKEKDILEVLILTNVPYYHKTDKNEEYYPAPTQSEAHKWLRGNFDTCVVVEPYEHATVGGKTISYRFWIWYGIKPICPEFNVLTNYEEAMETGLRLALNSIIECNYESAFTEML